VRAVVVAAGKARGVAEGEGGLRASRARNIKDGMRECLGRGRHASTMVALHRFFAPRLRTGATLTVNSLNPLSFHCLTMPNPCVFLVYALKLPSFHCPRARTHTYSYISTPISDHRCDTGIIRRSDQPHTDIMRPA